MMNVTTFQPDPTVKKVCVYFYGAMIRKNRFFIEKDLNLPMRLYPNAEFYIRCNCDTHYHKNLQYLNKVYSGAKIKLIPDTSYYVSDRCNNEFDVIWYMHFDYLFMGGVIDRLAHDNWMMLQDTKTKVHILFNDENYRKFEGLYEVCEKRGDKFKNYGKNAQLISQYKPKTDWSNVTLICNEDNFGQWVNDRPSDICKLGGINVAYLSNKILYDLPDVATITPHISNNIIGCYIGRYYDKRIKFFNKYFNKGINQIDYYGQDSDKLIIENISQFGLIDNARVKSLYSSGEYAYSIYIGRCKRDTYLGATFFEPLLNGIPIFMLLSVDPDKKIFPDMNVYFSNEDELFDILSKHDNISLTNLYNKQISSILNK